MKYDLIKTYDQQKIREYLSKLIKDGCKASLTKIHPKRSISQNKYLHVLFNLWGNEYGYTMDEAKTEVKWATGYYTYKDSGAVYYIPTSQMNSKELTIFIDKFRDWSAQTCDLYLPSPEDYLSEQIYFDNLIEKVI